MKNYILFGFIAASIATTAYAEPKSYAVIENGIVSNVVVGDLNDAGFVRAFPSVVELQSPGGIGSTYNNGEFSSPPEPTPPTENWISQTNFLRRFTTQERLAIRASTDPVIIDFMGLVTASPEINLLDPLTDQGLDYLTAQGLLATGRKSEILQ